MEIFKKLFFYLNEESVKYMVAEGVAVNLYGIERATADIDIILKLEEENLLRFINVVNKLGLKPKVPVKLEDFADAHKRKAWIEDKSMTVFSLYDPRNPFFLLDIFIETPFDFDEVYKKRKRMKFDETMIPVVPMEELIRMKEKSNRPQDRADIYYLKKIIQGWKDEK